MTATHLRDKLDVHFQQATQPLDIRMASIMADSELVHAYDLGFCANCFQFAGGYAATPRPVPPYPAWCSAAWWTGWHGPAAPGCCAGRRRRRAGGWQRNAAAHAAWRFRAARPSADAPAT